MIFVGIDVAKEILDSYIAEIVEQIQPQVQNSLITTIPDISFRMAAIV